MKTLGLIMAMITSIIGGVVCFFDFSSEGSAMTGLLGVVFTTVQFFLAILGFFKPVGAGIAIMAISGFVAVVAVATAAKFTLSVEIAMLACGYMIMYGGNAYNKIKGA